MLFASARYRTGRIKTALRRVLQIALIFAVSAFIVVERGTTLCESSFFLPLSCFSAVLVGPILIKTYRKDPHQTTKSRLCAAVPRATGAVLLILILSLVLVNLFFGYGHLIVPDAEVCAWALALSLTAATSAAASLALLVSQISLNAAK